MEDLFFCIIKEPGFAGNGKVGQIFQMTDLLIGLKSACIGDVFIQSEIERRKTAFI